MSSICLNRLQEERRNWRKNHPLGFYAKPLKDRNGNLNLMTWEMGIPGKKNTIWEGGVYPVTINFSSEYPEEPPECSFPENFYHPNVHDGELCLSLIDWDYRPSLTLRELSLGIQALLNEPIADSCSEACMDFNIDKKRYNYKVRQQAQKYSQ